MYDTLRRIITIDDVKTADGVEMIIETRDEEERLVQASFEAAMNCIDHESALVADGGN
jgi:hypothetical protein